MLKFLLLGFIILVVSAQDGVIPCKGKDDCCDGILCGINEGDCDSHENCAGHLRCGVDNCDGPSFDSTDDCCWNDPLFPPPSPAEDFETCEIVRDLEKKIAQAAVEQGCDLPEGRPEYLSLNECTQLSCSADLIGKSFTCNNQNKEKTCKELLSLLDAIVMKRTTQCSHMLRSVCNADNTNTSQSWCITTSHCGYCECGDGRCGCVSTNTGNKCFNSIINHPYLQYVGFDGVNITTSADDAFLYIPECNTTVGTGVTTAIRRQAHVGDDVYICRAIPKLIVFYDNKNVTEHGPQKDALAATLAQANTISSGNNCILASSCGANLTQCYECFSYFPACTVSGHFLYGNCAHLRSCNDAITTLSSCTGYLKGCANWLTTFPIGATGYSYWLTTTGTAYET